MFLFPPLHKYVPKKSVLHLQKKKKTHKTSEVLWAFAEHQWSSPPGSPQGERVDAQPERSGVAPRVRRAPPPPPKSRIGSPFSASRRRAELSRGLLCRVRGNNVSTRCYWRSWSGKSTRVDWPSDERRGKFSVPPPFGDSIYLCDRQLQEAFSRLILPMKFPISSARIANTTISVETLSY